MQRKVLLRRPMKRVNYAIIAIFAFALVLGLWTFASQSGAVNSTFLPSPTEVVSKFFAVSMTEVLAKTRG